MIKCIVCKKELESIYFWKRGALVGDTGEYFKLCSNCRAIGRQRNQKRKEQKNLVAKEYYEKNKEEVKRRNKKYREDNLDKLKAYDKSPERKAFHKMWLRKKRQEDPCRFLFYSAKQRSKKSNTTFQLIKKDIVDIYPIDGKCPMLGIPLVINIGQTKDDSPSLDRILPEGGYVKGNVIVISHRANRIKNNASLIELERIVSFLKNMEIK